MKNWIAIAAMAENRVIGLGNQIPWHLPADFKWVKKRTIGNTLLMGRKTFDSIGKPLPNRKTVVLSRQSGLEIPGVEVIHQLEELDSIQIRGNLYIAGGSEIYRMALPQCKELYLTQVKGEFEGDTFFPEFEMDFKIHELIEENASFSIYHFIR